MRFRVVSVFALHLVLAAACNNDNPVSPGFAPAPEAPTLTCPADLTESGVTGSSRTVTYAAPVLSGGHPPVTVSCTPSSGSEFPIGATLVTCNGVDGLAQQRTCAFTVTLRPLVLTVTKFVAFGDSLTEGENGFEPNGPCPTRAGVQCLDVPNAYPTVLQRLLRDDFPAQTPTVINAGVSGNRAQDDVARLPGVLSQHQPGALLILHGFNDLRREGAEAVTEVVGAIRDQIRIARQAGVQHVFVSTLVPPGTGFRMIDVQDIQEVNDGLRQMVPAEGARIVDAYPLFLGRESTLIAPDGLHLTPQGYRVLAEAFAAAIRSAATAVPARRKP